MSDDTGAPREKPPERVRSTPGPQPASEGPATDHGSGPLSVRDLMKKMTPEAEPPPEARADPRWEGEERSFDRDGAAWLARPAGAGAYGTGRLGTARLVAVHFFRQEAPDTPVREALLGAGVFPTLGPDELGALLDRATPIVTDR